MVGPYVLPRQVSPDMVLLPCQICYINIRSKGKYLGQKTVKTPRQGSCNQSDVLYFQVPYHQCPLHSHTLTKRTCMCMYYTILF